VSPLSLSWKTYHMGNLQLSVKKDSKVVTEGVCEMEACG
jgi:hypothetical protein